MTVKQPGTRQRIKALVIAAIGVSGLFVFHSPQSLLFLSGMLLNAWVTAFYAQPSSNATLPEIKAEFQTGDYARPRYVSYLSLLSVIFLLAAFIVNVIKH